MHLTSLFAFTLLLNFSLASPFTLPAFRHVFQRQAQTTTTCETYSSVANYTTISNNSTLRGAFMRSSPDGTDATTSILDTVTPLLPAMTVDGELNERCGNLTTVAIVGAASNFSRGVVGGFVVKTDVFGLHAVEGESAV